MLFTSRRPNQHTTLIQRLWPGRCLLCSATTTSGRICPPCRKDLPRNQHPCPRCAQPMPTPATPACAACLRRTPVVTRVIAPWIYTLPVDYLLHRFKYHGQLGYGDLLGSLLAEHLSTTLTEVQRPGLILPVPLHPARQRLRGFNQALELARPVAQRLNVPLESRRLHRIRATPEQVQLNARARRRNLRGAFSFEGICPPHVAIMDDVFTTGSTAAEIARVLRRAGAERIEVWCIARAVAREF